MAAASHKGFDWLLVRVDDLIMDTDVPTTVVPQGRAQWAICTDGNGKTYQINAAFVTGGLRQPKKGEWWVCDFTMGQWAFVGLFNPKSLPVVADAETLNEALIELGLIDPDSELDIVAGTIPDFNESVDDRVAALLLGSTNITVTYNDGAGTLTVAQTGLATDIELAGAITAHESAPNPHPGYATDADLTAHVGAADPHTGYATDGDLSAHAADTTAIHGIADTSVLLTTSSAAGGDLTGTLGNLQYAAGSIVNADVNAAAAIAYAKLNLTGAILNADLAGGIANSKLATDPLARANHTGTQLASTVSDFSEAVDDRVAALAVAGTGITIGYNDGANTLTFDVTGAPPTGSAGGDLTGSFPNPQIAAGVIVNADINAAAAIATSKLADSANFAFKNVANVFTNVQEIANTGYVGLIVDSATSGNPYLTFQHDNVDKGSIYTERSDGSMRLWVNGSDRVMISSAGVVTIGGQQVLVANSAAGGDMTGTLANLQYAAGSIVNADISGSAAIAYGKLALTGAILNADLAGSIAYSKLVLTGAITNADLAGSIATSKLTDGSDFARKSLATTFSTGGSLGEDDGTTGVRMASSAGLGYLQTGPVGGGAADLLITSMFAGSNYAILNASKITASGGLIYFGAAEDTNLYRSAANALKTDDALDVTGTLSQGGTAVSLSGHTHSYQPLDSDLTTIAGLTATTDNFLVSVASAWASRTPAQVRTTLGLVIGTNVQAWDADLDTWATKTAPSGTVVGTSDSQTLTTKTLALGSNTVSGSVAEFNAALTGADFYTSGGTDVALADGGTGASLTDPNADRILFWDDSAGAMTWLTLGTNLSITGTTIDAAGGAALADGDYGDIVVSGSGTVLSIDTGVIVNADINAGAAIAYSKLALTGAILNADLAGSIAYSKLSLTGAIVDADLASGIDASKLTTGTLPNARIANTSITNAQLAGSIAYSKLSLTGAILNADLAGSIAYSKLSLTGAILNADLAGSIAYSKLVLTNSIVAGDLTSNAVTTAKILDANVTTAKLAAQAVTTEKLSAGTVNDGNNGVTNGGFEDAQTADATLPAAWISDPLNPPSNGGTWALNASNALTGTKALALYVPDNSASSSAQQDTLYRVPVAPGQKVRSTVSYKGSRADAAGAFYLRVKWFKADGTASASAYDQIGALAVTTSYVTRDDLWTAPSDAASYAFCIIEYGPSLTTNSAITVYVDAVKVRPVILTVDLDDSSVTSAKIVDATIVNADISGSAAIAYSKLALTGAILNADLAGSIAYSKLSLTGAIVNADLASGIDAAKLTTGTLPNARIAAASITNAQLAGSITTANLTDGADFARISGTTFTGLVKVPKNTWSSLQASDSLPRFYFADSGTTYYRSGTSSGLVHEFRNADDSTVAQISSAGRITGTVLMSSTWIQASGEGGSGGALWSAGKLNFTSDGGSTWDTNLYRSAADVLKTDDKLVVGARAQVIGAEASTALTSAVPMLTVKNTNTTLDALNGIVFENAGGFYTAGIYALPKTDASANKGADLLFATKDAAGSAYLERMRISEAGAVTIGGTLSVGGQAVLVANSAAGGDMTGTLANLQYAAGSIVNADVSASAAIAYSKLALTGAILNADLAGSIAYSKLSLTGAILNADLAGSIALSKLATDPLARANHTGTLIVGRAVATGDVTVSATIGTYTALVTASTVPLINTHRYRVTAWPGFRFVSSSAVIDYADTWDCRIQVDPGGGYVGLTEGAHMRVRQNDQGASNMTFGDPFGTLTAYYVAAATGNANFKLEMAKTTGDAATTTAQTNSGASPFTIYIEDLGIV